MSSWEVDSSLIEPTQYDEVVTVAVKRLDSFLTSHVKCLKLEAEGAESEILEGIGEKLDLIEYIAADLGFEGGFIRKAHLFP